MRVILIVMAFCTSLSGLVSDAFGSLPSDFISWQSDTKRIIHRPPAAGGAWAPRLCELPNGDWLCAYDATENLSVPTKVYVAKSTDKGNTWSYLSQASNESTYAAANGEFQLLPNGDILCAYRVGLPSDPLKSLKVSKSTDNGQSWQYLVTIISNSGGVWEPDFLLKDDGQLLIFYANDDNSTGYDQCIEMQRSDDYGASWHSQQLVSGHINSRDGMPVPVLLNDDGILLVIEGAYSNVPPYQGRWVIMSLRSTDGGDTWSPRTIAFDPGSPTAAYAPFIVQVPRTGEVFLSCQTDEDGGVAYHKMKVLASSDNGHNFVLQSQPFRFSKGVGTLWNSLFAPASGYVIANTSTFESGSHNVQMIQMIKGLLKPLVALQKLNGDAGKDKTQSKAEDTNCWPREKAWQWYNSQPWPCGFNYIPANAISYTEMWMPYCFDPDLIDRELALAEKIGFNCLRVVLPYVVWEHDPKAFKKRLESFISICDKHKIKVMLTMFDDCVFGSIKDPVYGKQPEVVVGHYANGWTPSPGHSMVRNKDEWPKLKEYVQDVIRHFSKDSRIWVWDLYNEPTNSGLGNASIPLTREVFQWARQVDPLQPLTVATWYDNNLLNDAILANTDIVTFHRYNTAEDLEQMIEKLKSHGRPIICTEWLNRPLGSKVETHLPVFAENKVGCMHWGLVNGKTQTHLPWGHRPGDPEPKVWQHGLFRGDYKPYDPNELKLFQTAIIKSKKI